MHPTNTNLWDTVKNDRLPMRVRMGAAKSLAKRLNVDDSDNPMVVLDNAKQTEENHQTLENIWNGAAV